MRIAQHITSLIFCLLLILQGYAQQQGIYKKVNLDIASDASLHTLIQTVSNQFPELSQSSSELILLHQIESPGGFHYTFEQQYQGIPIYDCGVKANLNKKGKITSLLSTIQTFETEDNLRFQRSESAILEQVIQDFPDTKIEINPIFWINKNSLTPAYQAVTHGQGGITSLELIINADNGTEIQRTDRGAYSHRHIFETGDTTGRGRVFIPNPCTRAEVLYGPPFLDNNDAHSSHFEQWMDTVELKGISYNPVDSLFSLVGPYVKIADLAPFKVDPATSLDGDFLFTRDQDGFEDVMVYYHIDTFQRYVQSLGFTNLQNGPFRVDPHGKSDQDQSVFVPSGMDSYILFGDGGVDDAEDADVIIHEYGHALSHAAAPGTRSGTERNGLDEGIGDYFAAAYSYDLTNFGWDMVFNWDGHNEFWQGRTVISPLKYPPASTSIYVYGEIWAATLMEIRQDLGAAKTDQLALQEMYSNFAQMTLEDAARLFIDADSLLYEGVHTELIKFYFCQRGIIPEASCLNVNLGVEKKIETMTWDISPNPTEGDFILRFQPSPNLQAIQLRVCDLLGQEIHRQNLNILGTQVREWDLSLPPTSGIYLIQLWNEEQLIGTKKLQIIPE